MFWLRGKHPKEPSTWRHEVRDAKARVARWARGKLSGAEEDVFVDLWSKYKLRFSRKQHGKCGYCEMPIAPDPKGGDIDHYRPKAAIDKLLDDPATWGEEVKGHNRRDPTKKRRFVRACGGKGYWWLAYDFQNYLLACGTCNQKWKRGLFPIEGGHVRAPTRQSCAGERPLLLNPYGDVDPAYHLEYDRIGIVSPRNDSSVGDETIRTCHLGRESVRRSREPVAMQAWPLITRVLRELARSSHGIRLRRALGDLLRVGHARRPHAGMVRSLWSQRDPYGFSWEQLRALHAALKENGRPAAS